MTVSGVSLVGHPDRSAWTGESRTAETGRIGQAGLICNLDRTARSYVLKTYICAKTKIFIKRKFWQEILLLSSQPSLWSNKYLDFWIPHRSTIGKKSLLKGLSGEI
jgi:hypothetical protein